MRFLKPFSCTVHLLVYAVLIWIGPASFSPLPVYAEKIFALRLAPKPFSPNMCKKTGDDSLIQILAANHRNLVIQRVPGQYIPTDPNEARVEDYVHFVTLNDLTNGRLTDGAIAFTANHAAIFTEVHPKGISRPQFLAGLPENQQTIANTALNTFLRLRSILNAAIDSCRPYPARIVYETDDEILRIEKGKHAFQQLVKAFNADPTPQSPLFLYETGKSEGFFDPDAGKGSNVSYQALNPLNFYVPTVYP